MGFFDWLEARSRNDKQSSKTAVGQITEDTIARDALQTSDPPSESEVRMIGLWTTASDDADSLLGFPHPASLADRNWEAKRRDRIASYLRGGHPLVAYMGYSFCRFEDCRHPERDALGTKDLTDGQWAWPEGLWHYIADHSLRLPDAFVANASLHGFEVPAEAARNKPGSVDVSFWLRWVAENTAPPPAHPTACALAEAQAVCAELSTKRWSASVVHEHARWKIRRESGSQAFEDFTGPISADSLRNYLFRFRLLEAESVLSPQQAKAIATEYALDGHEARLFAGMTDENGQAWWALIMSGKERPTKPLEELDLNAIEIPQPGWAAFLPGGWKVEVARGMDEPAWRFFLQEWRRRLLPTESGSSTVDSCDR